MVVASRVEFPFHCYKVSSKDRRGGYHAKRAHSRTIPQLEEVNIRQYDDVVESPFRFVISVLADAPEVRA